MGSAVKSAFGISDRMDTNEAREVIQPPGLLREAVDSFRPVTAREREAFSSLPAWREAEGGQAEAVRLPDSAANDSLMGILRLTSSDLHGIIKPKTVVKVLRL